MKYPVAKKNKIVKFSDQCIAQPLSQLILPEDGKQRRHSQLVSVQKKKKRQWNELSKIKQNTSKNRTVFLKHNFITLCVVQFIKSWLLFISHILIFLVLSTCLFNILKLIFYKKFFI